MLSLPSFLLVVRIKRLLYKYCSIRVFLAILINECFHFKDSEQKIIDLFHFLFPSKLYQSTCNKW